MHYIFYFFIIIILSFAICPAYGKANVGNSLNAANPENKFNSSVTIAERDILYFYITPNVNITANLTLLLYHEAWIINNDDVSINITIYASIPKKDYKQLSYQPGSSAPYSVIIH